MVRLPVAPRLDVDADRDGAIEAGEQGRWDWEWKAGGRGAVVIADLGQAGEEFDLAEMRMVVEDNPDGLAIGVSIDPVVAERVTIYRKGPAGLEPVAGSRAASNGVPSSIGSPLNPAGETLWLQAHTLPGRGFDGLVEIFLVAFVPHEGPHGTRVNSAVPVDQVAVRVAPWIMTSNSQPPARVYTVSLSGQDSNMAIDNKKFLAGLRAACEEASVELVVLPEGPVGSDQWMQDEIEFGYCQSPDKVVDIVCDGPRNRPLDLAAEAGLLGAGVGSFEVRAHLDARTSLDSFGNLEVSPPVTVAGRHYPFGRIMLGTKRTFDDNGGRKPSLALRQFLHEQRVQTPIEIYTDWLAVGHVDEILSVVPGASAVGFRTLVASPRRAREVFDKLMADGHGDERLWRGQQRITADGQLADAEETVSDLSGRAEFWEFNAACQEVMDEVAGDLCAGLGVEPTTMVAIPVAFKKVEDGRALAYFPDMVNHLVLGDLSVVPRPYGPVVDGVDVLEKAFVDAVPDRRVIFIDDWLPYHEMSGEVHCGTNVLRRPDSDTRWWEHQYEGVYDFRSVGRPAERDIAVPTES